MLNIHMQRSSVLTRLQTMIKKRIIQNTRGNLRLIFNMNDLKTFQIKIVTLNVRGLNGSTKRRSIFRWLHNQKAHIYFLQETYSDEKTKASWEAEWGGKIFCSHGTKHSKGVMILLNPKYDINVIKFQGRVVQSPIKLTQDQREF